MSNIEKKDKEDDFFSTVRKIRKNAKDDILDDAFKRAEIKKELQPEKRKKDTKKPFLKLGFILIFIAILSLLIINYLPWIYIKYDTGYGTVQETFWINFENSDEHYNKEIDNIFESPCTNCSNNSINFLGITKNDFTNVPKITTYAFLSLAMLGIIFTIYEIIERKRKLSYEFTLFVHSTIAVAALFLGIFVIYLFIKFIGVYFLLFYNKPFIEASGVKDVTLIFPVSINLIVISFAIIMIGTAVMQINFHEFEKKILSEKTYSALSTFKFGIKT